MAKRKRTRKNGETYFYNIMYISGVPEDVNNDLVNIAFNLGNVPVSDLIKPELRKLRDSYPVNMRQPKNAI